MAPRVQTPASLLVQHDVPASTSVPRLTIFARAFHVYLLFRSAGGVVVTGLLADPDRVLWFAAEIPRDFVCSYLIWSPCCDLEGWEARWLASWLLLWFGTWERLARGGTHVKRRRGRALPVGAPPLAHVLLGHVMSNPLPFPPGNGHCASVPSFPALCCGQVTVARQPWSGGDTSAHIDGDGCSVERTIIDPSIQMTYHGAPADPLYSSAMTRCSIGSRGSILNYMSCSDRHPFT